MYNKRKHKVFVNLEKERGIQGQIQQFTVTEKETSDEKRINADIELFKKKKCKEIFCWAHNIFRYTFVTYTKWKQNATMSRSSHWKGTAMQLW